MCDVLYLNLILLQLESAVLVRYLKLVVTKAFDHFVSIHSIHITPT